MDAPTPALALSLTVDEAAALLRCGRRRVFELIADGTLTKAPRYGRHTVVTTESVHAALEAPVEDAPKKRVRFRSRMNDAGFDAMVAEFRTDPGAR